MSRTATRAVRAEPRKVHERKSEQERQRFLDEITGRIYREQQEAKKRQTQLGSVAGVLKLFAGQHRNDTSTEAIADFLDDAEHYPVKDVAAALAELQASGNYDHIIAEGAAMPGD